MTAGGLTTDLREKRGSAFGPTAEAYDKGRPEFAKVAIDSLMAGLPSQNLSTVRAVDIGAGTGMWTECLVKSGLKEVIAVEPSEDMLKELSKKLPQVQAINRPGEDTGIEGNSVDLVTFSLCWHWLNPDRACRELDRILKPNGVVALIWNLFDDTVDWVRPILSISGGDPAIFDMIEKHHRPQLTAGLEAYHEFEHKWTKRQSLADVEAYCLTTSHYTTQTEEGKKQLIEDLRKHWNNCKEIRDKDFVEIPFVTRITLIKRANL